MCFFWTTELPKQKKKFRKNAGFSCWDLFRLMTALVFTHIKQINQDACPYFRKKLPWCRKSTFQWHFRESEILMQCISTFVHLETTEETITIYTRKTTQHSGCHFTFSCTTVTNRSSKQPVSAMKKSREGMKDVESNLCSSIIGPEFVSCKVTAFTFEHQFSLEQEQMTSLIEVESCHSLDHKVSP